MSKANESMSISTQTRMEGIHRNTVYRLFTVYISTISASVSIFCCTFSMRADPRSSLENSGFSCYSACFSDMWAEVIKAPWMEEMHPEKQVMIAEVFKGVLLETFSTWMCDFPQLVSWDFKQLHPGHHLPW